MSNTSNTATPQAEDIKVGDTVEIIDDIDCAYEIGERVELVRITSPFWGPDDTSVYLCMGKDGCLQYLDRFQFKKFQS